MSMTLRKLYPPMRPDGSSFRSYRAAPPEPSWAMRLIDGVAVRTLRLARGLESQRALADLLSSGTHQVRQAEVACLEHGGCWVNDVYLDQLAAALGCARDLLVGDERSYRTQLALREAATRWGEKPKVHARVTPTPLVINGYLQTTLDDQINRALAADRVELARDEGDQ